MKAFVHIDMDSKPSHGTDVDKPVSPNENPRLPDHNDRTSLSTDSMVTIRLSDTIFMPDVDAPTCEQLYQGPNDVDLLKNDEKRSSPQVDDIAVDTEQDEIALEELNQMPKAFRNSRASVKSDGENIALDSMLATFRSRSNSSGTLSSSDSAHVDWDELDKSEEQAPRDEGSDEVYLIQTYRICLSNIFHSQLHFFLQGLNKKTMLLQQIRRQQSPEQREAKLNLDHHLSSTLRSS